MKLATLRGLFALALVLPLGACAGNSAIQPDRAVFNLDGNYQRFSYALPIEQTFDNTVKVFREAGYTLDVADRATGQLSGTRGKTGDPRSANDKGLKFYALVLPAADGQSQVGVKIVQTVERGFVVNKTRTEMIVADREMYQYLFQRIASVVTEPGLTPTGPMPGALPEALPVR